ncbi:MAG: dihydrofolate reductase family protein [Candidatus Berkiella sp.]
MAKVIVFEHLSTDGYFMDEDGDISWTKNNHDPQFNEFTSDNIKQGGILVFGRITYELMARYWPTPEAFESFPDVALSMNNLPKIVFSKTLREATWSNTHIIHRDLLGQMQKLKEESKSDIVILGSGSVVAQVTSSDVIDEYQFIYNPIILGSGRTLFDGVHENTYLKLLESKAFQNGKVFVRYKAMRSPRK